VDAVRLLISHLSPLLFQDDKDAFYVADLGDILKKHLRWLKALPRVTPFYAVKCNDSRAIVDTLAAVGTGFDCASKVSRSSRAWNSSLQGGKSCAAWVISANEVSTGQFPVLSVYCAYSPMPPFFFRLKYSWCRVSGCLQRGLSMQILVNKCLKLSMLPVMESR
jgi:hypothetical protein